MTVADLTDLIATLGREQLAALLAAISARLLTEPPSPAPQPPAPADELLSVKQAARLLGKSESWLYHNQDDLPFKVPGIGKAPRFSRRGLEQYIAKRQASKC
jgi:predicted DNA-binding transcriptional regulator AlpA